MHEHQSHKFLNLTFSLDRELMSLQNEILILLLHVKVMKVYICIDIRRSAVSPGHCCDTESSCGPLARRMLSTSLPGKNHLPGHTLYVPSPNCHPVFLGLIRQMM